MHFLSVSMWRLSSKQTPSAAAWPLCHLLHTQRATHVVSTIAPQGLPLYDPVLATQLKLLKQLAPPAAADTATCAAAGGGSGGVPLRWIGYLSSTGVYGDWGGDWVDEDSDTRCAAV